MIEIRPKRTHERALLIGLEKQGVSKWDLQDSLDELAELANSAGAEVVDTVTQKLPKPTAPYYIGKGKAEEIKDSFHEREVTSVIFDDELSPAQGRNLENLLSRKVLDRTQLILDIFAQRARSREGRLQIELAQLQYLLPRLTRMWNHLSRQTGGIGTRGPGETQLEVDRRRVQERIARLGRELEGVRKVRSVQRQGRKRHQWPVAAVVGYTNAGKSTLLNLLTGADLLADRSGRGGLGANVAGRARLVAITLSLSRAVKRSGINRGDTSHRTRARAALRGRVRGRRRARSAATRTEAHAVCAVEALQDVFGVAQTDHRSDWRYRAADWDRIDRLAGPGLHRQTGRPRHSGE